MMKILKQSILPLLLLLITAGGRAQETEPDYKFDEVSGWLKVTSGTLDLTTISKPVTVIEVAADVTITNVPNSDNFQGVGDGTLLNPQGAELTSNKNIESPETYVRMADVDGGTYTIGSSGLGTLCFPNSVSLEDTGIRAFKAVSVESSQEDVDYLVLEEATDEDYMQIPANTPVILYKQGGGTVELGSTGTVSQAPTTISQENNLLVGINNTMTVQPEDGSEHFLMQSYDGNVGFYPAVDKEGKQRSFKATRYRCYLNLPTSNSVKALSFVIPDEEVPSTSNINSIRTQPDGFYDLRGQAVLQPQNGQVYIMRLNGRNVKVKL